MTQRMHAMALTFAIGLGLAGGVAAQEYPSQPIKLVVPYSAGGGTDGVARILAKELREALDQTVIVENKPGAGATIGHDYVARAKPDGYTLIVSANTLAVFDLMYKNLPFDPAKAFTPIADIANSPMVLAGHGKLPYGNLQEVLQANRGKGKPLYYGTAGVGTPMHLAGELLAFRTGERFEHVPYKGSGPALADVIAGHIPFGVFGLSSTLNHIRDGNLKAFGVFESERTSLDPELATMAEAGVPDAAAPLIYTVLAPAGTPEPVVRKLTSVLKTIITGEAIKPLFAAQGFVPQYGTPEQVTRTFNAEAARWKHVLEATKVSFQ
ncbi:tripartite tricarboxylate transporter substrate-binding protein [Orrella sp. JC864]|uniref:Bug family tripartite tricarboxylate transporter substrate binding protein n=1 Tax=Orrella sp. JC864 TaxID=3120298 RepID=UPI00300A2A7F